MQKTVITYGLIAGVIIFCLSFLTATLCAKGIIRVENSEVLGYGAMVISLSMIFFGIKSYRDNYGNGKITFWKGVQIGLLISLIGSVMYYAGAEVYANVYPEFVATSMDKYREHNMNKMREKGASAEEVAKADEDMAKMIKMLDNPLFMFVIALMEFLPVGIIITLLSAAILRKREMLPAV